MEQNPTRGRPKKPGSLAELAGIAGVSRSTATRWARRGLVVWKPSGQIDMQATLARVEEARRKDAMMTHDPVSPDLARLKARVLRGRARLLELKAKAEAGRYVDAEEVRLAAFNRARIVRDALLNIPDRVAAIVAAESDPRHVHDILMSEIRETLNELAGDGGVAEEMPS